MNKKELCVVRFDKNAEKLLPELWAMADKTGNKPISHYTIEEATELMEKLRLHKTEYFDALVELARLGFFSHEKEEQQEQPNV